MSPLSRSTKLFILNRPSSFSILLRLDPSTTHFVNNLRRNYLGDSFIPWTHVPLIQGLPLVAFGPARQILIELTHDGIQRFEISLGRPFINTRTLKSVGFGIPSTLPRILHSNILKRLPDVVDCIKKVNAKCGNPNRKDARIFYQPRVMIQFKVGVDEAEQTRITLGNELDRGITTSTVIGFTLREIRFLGELLEDQIPDEEFSFVKQTLGTSGNLEVDSFFTGRKDGYNLQRPQLLFWTSSHQQSTRPEVIRRKNKRAMRRTKR